MADEQGVPAFMIFHDATLAEFVELLPETLEQLATVAGVGKRKLSDYGDTFLDTINEYRNQESIANSDTEEETIQLFRLGNSADAIAEQRGLKATTIYNHLANGIERDEIPLQDVIKLEAQQLEAIRFAIEQFDGGKRLKPVFEALEEEYPYEILRCVRSDMTR